MDDGAEPKPQQAWCGSPAPDLAAMPAALPPERSDESPSIVRLAARIARAPIALMIGAAASLAWIDPALTLPSSTRDQLREIAERLANPAAIIPDATRDPRLRRHPAVVSDPGLRFIACVPLVGASDEALGALCVMDLHPRPRLSIDHADALADLAALAARLIGRERDAAARPQRAQTQSVQTQRAQTQRAWPRPSTGAAGDEPVEAATLPPQTCERALSDLLDTLCERHRAAAGFVGKIASASRVAQAVCRYADLSEFGRYVARCTSSVAAPDTSYAAAAVEDGATRVLTFADADDHAAYPAVAEAIRMGLRAEIIQPLRLVDERFGIVMLFGEDRPDLDAIAEDVAAAVALARPALYRLAAEQRTRLLSTALDRANDAVLITEAGPLGASGPKIVYANASFCQESGYALEEVLGQPHNMLHGPRTDAAAVGRLRQEMRRWKPARAELLNYRKDGAEFWAELDLTPIADESGQPTHWVSIQRDVTGRRNTEAAQRRHEASFRMLFQDNPLPMVVIARRDLSFLEVNGAAIQQYGWSRDEFLAKALPDLSPASPALAAAPSVPPLAAAPSVPPLAAGSPDPPDASTTHIRHDGSVLEVRSLVHDTIYAGQDATLAVLWDVTDLEAARRDMRHANEMLRERTLQLHARTEELAEAQRLARLSTWRFAVDHDDPAWLRDVPRVIARAHCIPGQPPARVHADDHDAVRAALEAVAREGRSQTFEYRTLLAQDQARHLRAEARPVLDSQGRVIELFGYSQDISEDKRAEQATLRNESLRALGQLTGGVAHDFNNLLTVIILNLEEAEELLPQGHELREILPPALHAAVRGAELTSQLLSYARRATLRPERVRPDEFFGALRPLLNRLLGERFELQVLLRHDGGSAMVDPAQLDNAIMNLVINARDAMPQGGAIVLETRSVVLAADAPGFQDDITPGRYVVVSVTDTGEGIPPHLLARVFEPFFTTKAAGKGSGMGLSMVYGFARQSGGHVAIDSQLGRGTAVSLYLPLAPATPQEAGVDGEEPPAWDAHGMSALVVEDQESVLRSVMRMLRHLGFGVTGASSADIALKHLDADAPFDLLFTDIVLPGALDGVALAEAVGRRSPGTRILLTSGFTEHRIAATGASEPRMDFLMKPYKRQDLQAKFCTMFPRVPGSPPQPAGPAAHGEPPGGAGPPPDRARPDRNSRDADGQAGPRQARAGLTQPGRPETRR